MDTESNPWECLGLKGAGGAQTQDSIYQVALGEEKPCHRPLHKGQAISCFLRKKKGVQLVMQARKLRDLKKLRDGSG